MPRLCIISRPLGWLKHCEIHAAANSQLRMPTELRVDENRLKVNPSRYDQPYAKNVSIPGGD